MDTQTQQLVINVLNNLFLYSSGLHGLRGRPLCLAKVGILEVVYLHDKNGL